MSHSNAGHRDFLTSAAFTRRGFIGGASVAGAGLLLPGSAGILALADDTNPSTRKQATRFFGPTSVHSDGPPASSPCPTRAPLRLTSTERSAFGMLPKMVASR